MRLGRGRWWVAAALLVVLGAGGTAAVHLRGTALPGTAASPRSRVGPPPDPVRGPLLGRLALGAPDPSAAALLRALGPALRDPRLGTRLAVSVVDATTGSPLYEQGAFAGVVPASTTKIATAVAALVTLPHDRRLRTRVLAGPGPGDIVLVGGGDPTLAGTYPVSSYPRPARLLDLARGVHAALGAHPVRRVLVDDQLYAGPRLGPGWKPTYVTFGDVAPVSALEVDEGRTTPGDHVPRVPDAALEAGRQLAALLGGPAGGAVSSIAVLHGAARAGARELAHADGPMTSQLVEGMLTRSDNDLAEALGRQVALAKGQPATFEGEAASLRVVLGDVLDGLHQSRDAVRLVDASGLSPRDRVEPGALTRVLTLVARDPRFGPVLSGLPVAGFDGTLAQRYRHGPAAAAAGAVRAKTGTLSGVSALAGLVRTHDGRLLAFDLTADGVQGEAVERSQRALDRVAAVLARCGCG